MVGIQGLGGVPDPKPEGPAKVERDRDREARVSSSAAGAASAQDGVSISDAARHASEVSRLVQLATGSAQVRAEKVEAARQSLERGDYKNPEVVAKVAEKIAKYLG